MNKHGETQARLIDADVNRVKFDPSLHQWKTSVWDYSRLTSESLRADCILMSVQCLCGDDLHCWNERGNRGIWK